MSKSNVWMAGIATLIAGVGCAGADLEPTEQESSPLAAIQVAEGRRIEFYAAENGVMIAERYELGDQPILSDADKLLSAPDLHRRFAAPGAAIPDSLFGGAEVSDAQPAELVRTLETSAAGGGQSRPTTRIGEVEGVTRALSLGEGCNPTQRNVVFNDCRRNWFGGYFAEGVATWFFDDRVQAVQGSLNVRVTSRHGGKTFVHNAPVPQGTVLQQRWPKARVCRTILGVDVDCWDVKSQRRLDVTNASSTTFHVDVVFFNG